eukprot:802525-Amphidinium_carterae.1
MAKPDAYKPTHRLTTKQPTAIVGQLDSILETKELSLENNEDTMEKKNVETIIRYSHRGNTRTTSQCSQRQL